MILGLSSTKTFLYVNQKSKMTTSTGNAFHIRYYSNCKFSSEVQAEGKLCMNDHLMSLYQFFLFLLLPIQDGCHCMIEFDIRL